MKMIRQERLHVGMLERLHVRRVVSGSLEGWKVGCAGARLDGGPGTGDGGEIFDW